MPRFHLHQRLAGGQVIEDEEGADFDGIEAARDEAVAAGRERMSETILSGHVALGTVFEVCDPAGKLLLELSYAEALTLCHATSKTRRSRT